MRAEDFQTARLPPAASEGAIHDKRNVGKGNQVYNRKNYPSRGLSMVVTRTLENYCITILPGN